MHTETYTTFDKDNHLCPDFDKTTFETLHSWELGWELLDLINIADSVEDEPRLSKQFSPGQKALYFFWYIDGQVTNGGFIQFYFNGYDRYLPPIIAGLKLIGDSDLLALIEQANIYYLVNKPRFDAQIATGESPAPLYKNLKGFEKYDEQYYKIHDKTMDLLEVYARQYPQEFCSLIG